MHFNTLLLNYDHGCATVTLNRPDKRNAISYELIDELWPCWRRWKSRARMC